MTVDVDWESVDCGIWVLSEDGVADGVGFEAAEVVEAAGVACEVVELHAVEVHQREAAHSGLGQLYGNLRTETAEADNHHALSGEGSDFEYSLAAREEVAACWYHFVTMLAEAAVGRGHEHTHVAGRGDDNIVVARSGGGGVGGEEHLALAPESVAQGMKVQMHYIFVLPSVAKSVGAVAAGGE